MPEPAYDYRQLRYMALRNIIILLSLLELKKMGFYLY